MGDPALSSPYANNPYAKFAPQATQRAADPADTPGYERALTDARAEFKKIPVGNVEYTTSSAMLDSMPDLQAGFDAAATGLGNLFDRAQGKTPRYSMAEAHRATLKAAKEAYARYEHDHPIAAPIEDIIGALSTPGVSEADAALKLRKVPGILRAAGIGGALGAGQGFFRSSGSAKERAKAAVHGGEVGVAVGPVVHVGGKVVASVAGKVAPSVVRGARYIAEQVRGRGQSEADRTAAGAKVGTRAVRDIVSRRDPSGTRLQGNEAEKAGKDVTAAEALGPHAVARLRRVARGEGPTADQLVPRMADRNRQVGQRVARNIAQVAGVDMDAVEGDFEASNEKLREKAAPLYQAWHAQRNVDSPELQAIRKTVQFKKAMTHAAELISADRESAFELGLTDEEMGDFLYRRAMALPGESTAASFEANRIPTAKGYDYVKRGLDQSLEKFRDKDTGRLDLSSPEARAILKVRRELNAELTNPEQPWGKAAAAAFKAGGDPIQQEEAFHSAAEVMSNALSDHDFEKRIAKYSPAQMAALKAGVVNYARNQAMASRTRIDSLLTDTAVMKIKRIFGPGIGAKVIRDLQMEREMLKTGTALTPEATVGSDEHDREVRHAAGEIYHGFSAFLHGAKGNIPIALFHYLRFQSLRGARYLETPEGRAANDRIGELLSMAPSKLAQTLEADGNTPEQVSKVQRVIDAIRANPALHDMTATTAKVAGLTGGKVAADESSYRSTQSPGPENSDAGSGFYANNPYAKMSSGKGNGALPASVADKSDARYDEPLPDHSTKATAGDYFSHVLGYPVDVSSAQRTVESNRMAGGVSNSAHLAGEAYDLQPHGVSYEQAALDFAHSGIPFDQIIIEPDNVHVSFDPRFRGQIFYWKKGQGRVAAPSESGGDNLDTMAMGQDAAPDFGADDSTDDDQQ